MKNNFIMRKSLPLALSSILFAILFYTPAARAQTTVQPLITWKTTGSYIPSFYQGKAFPTYGSKITASIEIISEGKIANLQSQTIYWYVNGTLIGGGAGVQQITFPVIGASPNVQILKASLPSWSGGSIAPSVQIPMVNPVAVIYSPYPGGEFSASTISAKALPYFFNISSPNDLSYTWSANGQDGSNTENPDTAQIILPQGTQSGTNVNVGLTISNNKDSTAATASTDLTYVSSL